ncbi:hypothetical protein [Burkholderia ubonensis]|uniref:hypothetical protein n=1 Tax=Burkholderia ubonensis TaxID=101571 RepID=UPI0012F72205|nr:hypothetical protein [Burkholderia ubonensis]
MARRPHGPRSRGIVIVARTKSPDASGVSLKRVFSTVKANGISGARGRMDARMGVMDDTRFFANFRWRSREPTARKRFITLNGRRRADARRHAGAARHAGRQRRYFA